MAKKIVVDLEPRTARILGEMRASAEEERSAPPPDDPDDLETALRNVNANVALARAYARGDEEAARTAKAQMSPRARWEGTRAKAGEAVVFSFITYKSKAHRNAVNAKVMKDPSMQGAPPKMPFDINRMMYGGFKVAVEG